MTILVTGGAGFIGSNFIHDWFQLQNEGIVNLDLLTYAGNPANLAQFEDRSDYKFVKGDIGDTRLVESLLEEFRPRAIINFAAESHVDRSIHGPAAFVQTNVVGSFNLLECARAYWQRLSAIEASSFRFLHVSTDEIYGSLKPSAAPFSESHPPRPNSPYSATKAASDHLVRAYHRTYGLPVLTTNCSNNYGPYQFPEKLIPLIIHNALAGRQLPIYGDGLQVRDWLYVADHCSAVRRVLESGQPGQVYNIGGDQEKTNLEVVQAICNCLESVNSDLLPTRSRSRGFHELVTFVPDRPGHDRRYAIDAAKIRSELGWAPVQSFESGLTMTVEWYLRNQDWVAGVVSGEYQNWISRQYA